MSPSKATVARNRQLALGRVASTATASRTPATPKAPPAPQVERTPPASVSKKAPAKRKRGINLDYCEYNLSDMLDSRGGFILKSIGPAEEAVTSESVEDPSAPIPNDALCVECSSIDVCAELYTHYNVMACRRCRNTCVEKYALLTKAECREDYLLTESELRDTTKLPHWMKKNPHGDTFANMLLYLRMHVESFAIKKWGSLERLDQEFERRGVTKKARKQAKFESKLNELRKKTLTSTWMRLHDDLEHQHDYGEKAEVDGCEGVYQQVCRTCGVSFEFEEL
ncbi:XPA protein C-terminus-domain-containing protein [Obelidium mucronatum]|nr:XPA protein C-terminus-domain-containing protein [Obelidium mucronatum]